MDLINLKSEDFSKKSSANLLKIIDDMAVENKKYQDEITVILDKQDELFVVYSEIMKTLAKRSHN